ncbi:MAG: aminopeptidase P N-terminal domain-containing protein [Bacilli bacterium]|nr:M24 family metallopeptidase [Erysipelotrichia bacterium]
MIKSEEFSLRRKLFIEKMANNSLALVFSGLGRKVSNDNFFYEVNRNFYYLTGIDQENSSLMILKTSGEVNLFLFIDEKDPNKEKWTGLRLSLDEARQKSDIHNVLFHNSFGPKLENILSSESEFGAFEHLYLDLEEELKIRPSYSTIDLKKELESKHPDMKVVDLHPLLTSLRMIKSPSEIYLMKQAIEITDLAFKNVILNLRPGLYEYNIRNIINQTINDNNNRRVAFETIVAGGKNAIILHYPHAKDMLEDGELVLLDFGAANAYYNADISRTLPINGKFSNKQKLIYNIVLGCNEAVINFIRPGLTLAEIQKFSVDYLAAECHLKGLINSRDDILQVYYHGVSHHLGLDVHDVCDRTLPLEPGMVLTVEPGLYFKDLKIGIRIEDNVLVTESGAENLSKNIIKKVEDIETLFLSKETN